MKPTYQIDLIPQLEDGLWVVREELLLDDNPDKSEVVEEYRFKTKEEANAFIDRWIENNR
jgi:hypothetical protein